jgi:hypothetical protein
MRNDTDRSVCHSYLGKYVDHSYLNEAVKELGKR